MFGYRSRALLLVPAASLAAANCDGGTGSSMRVVLVAPAHQSVASSRTVTFQWSVVNPEAPLACRVYTDKGRDPLDGNFEDSFPAGGAQQVTVELDQTRYSGATILWAVRCNETESGAWRLTLP